MSGQKRWDLLWRAVIFIASVVGIFWLLTFLMFFGESEALLLGIVPLITGLICAMAPMEPRTRILLLWIAAALLGIMAILSLLSGVGLLFLIIVAAYVMSAWMLNEADAAPQ